MQPTTTPHPPTAADRALIQRARLGDEVAWAQLVRHHQTTIFRLAYLILADEAEAEDIAQEAFIRAYLKLHHFDDQRPFRPWLLSITTNLARNRRRHLNRYWSAIQRFLNQHQTEFMSANSAPQSDAQLLWQAVKQLRPAAQEVIYLRYFLALSEAETAAALNIPPGTVKSRLHRALKQLRAIITTTFPELNE